MDGIVVKSTGSWYNVRQDDGRVVECRLRGQFRIHGIKSTNPVVVGDHVHFEMEPDGTGTILNISPRKNYIERKSTNLSKISHIIAANIDQAFLLVTLKQPRTSLGFIDRFLVAAEGFRIPVCLVFNKMDLYTPEELAVVEELTLLYGSIGYGTLRTSAVTGEGVAQLRNMMADKVSLFSGHSGTGKSALIRQIDPSLDIRVGEISRQHQKGKHTTTFAEMFPVAGGYMMDTPGIKEFGLIQYSKEEIRDYFPEIRAYNNQCRFDDCTHVHEPDCAVMKAVEQGLIAETRYLNYLAILEDDDMKLADWKLD
ncbi:MAG: ribosome small subunit-dependent GTPase A [Bacteroidales bacterium]|nr:ribosome small subunit-dependent GTPase A [Bacteroidales bacterium]MBR6161748.1 ribosome small subunit-dependent GTPase A [Bacteroidales bacterium]